MNKPSADGFVPPEGFRAIRETGGFDDWIGPIYSRRLEDGHYRLGFLAEQRHVNPQGAIHGGMMMSVCDTMMGIAVFRAIGKKRCATIGLNAHFVAGAKIGDWIEASAEIVRRGQSVVFVRGALERGDTCLMTADGIWKVLE